MDNIDFYYKLIGGILGESRIAIAETPDIYS